MGGNEGHDPACQHQFHVAAPSFIQEQRTESLGRYAMLKFMYRLGRGQDPRGGGGWN